MTEALRRNYRSETIKFQGQTRNVTFSKKVLISQIKTLYFMNGRNDVY